MQVPMPTMTQQSSVYMEPIPQMVEIQPLADHAIMKGRINSDAAIEYLSQFDNSSPDRNITNALCLTFNPTYLNYDVKLIPGANRDAVSCRFFQPVDSIKEFVVFDIYSPNSKYENNKICLRKYPKRDTFKEISENEYNSLPADKRFKITRSAMANKFYTWTSDSAKSDISSIYKLVSIITSFVEFEVRKKITTGEIGNSFQPVPGVKPLVMCHTATMFKHLSRETKQDTSDMDDYVKVHLYKGTNGNNLKVYDIDNQKEYSVSPEMLKSPQIVDIIPKRSELITMFDINRVGFYKVGWGLSPTILYARVTKPKSTQSIQGAQEGFHAYYQSA